LRRRHNLALEDLADAKGSAMIQSMMRSNNIPRFVQSLEDEKYIYHVMELCEGLCICDTLEQRGPFNETDAANVMCQLLEALGTVHAKGYAHCDVKCDNVILDGNLKLKLVDFEYARPFKGGLRGVYGSPSYIAPEIITK